MPLTVYNYPLCRLCRWRDGFHSYPDSNCPYCADCCAMTGYAVSFRGSKRRRILGKYVRKVRKTPKGPFSTR